MCRQGQEEAKDKKNMCGMQENLYGLSVQHHLQQGKIL